MSTTYDPQSAFGQYLNQNEGAINAYQYIASLLQNYGLNLADAVKTWMIEGVTNGDALMQRIRETDQYKTRFSGLIKRQQMGLPPISESEAISLERAYIQQARMAGIPDGLLTQDRIQELIAGDVSNEEFGRRILDGYTDFNAQPQAVKDEWKRLGFGDGAAAAVFADPDIAMPVLERQLAAAKISGAAVQAGWGGLTADQALSLANRGVTQNQASQAFGTLSQQEGMLAQSAGDGTAISKDTALKATFENNAEATQQINRRRSEKQSKFSGGGNFTDANKQGITGVGSNG